MSKKEETKKVSKKVENKSTKAKKVEKTKVKKESFFTGVKKEMKHVRWPLKKEMVKYSIATLSFIIFFALFFALTDLIIAGIKMSVA